MNAPTAAVLVSVLAVALAAVGGGDAQHAGEPELGVAPNPAPYHLAGGAWQIPGPFAWVPEYAFAQTPDVTPPTFVSSELNLYTGVLSITFSETIDVTPATHVVSSKMHIRESGTYAGGVTLTAGELGTAANGNVISFILTPSHLTTVTGLTAPELTIEPGAVRDTAGNLIIGTFDVSTASFVDSLRIGSQEFRPRGVAFSSDGAKMFVVGNHGDNVNEYTLTTPFDISTASYAGNNERFSVASQENNPRGVAFSSNGTKMFVVGSQRDNVNEYTLSTPFDVSTAAFNSVTFSVASQETFPQGVAFSSDGAKMFVVGTANKSVNEYPLTTPFDISTASYAGDNERFRVASQDSNPTDVAFSSDGAKMFVVGSVGDRVNEYTLSTPFDVSTASFVDFFSVGQWETAPGGVAFSSDGAKMFVVGNIGRLASEYTLSSVYPITVIDPFVTTWNMQSGDLGLEIPVHFGLGHNYTVIWGDGNTTTGVDGDATHTYAAARVYPVQIYGTYPSTNIADSNDASNLVSIDQWGSNRWTSMESAFAGAAKMTYAATDAPDLSGVANMSSMFADTVEFNGDLSGWDVSQVTDMNSMFSKAAGFNGDISSWNVSSVTDMSLMFSSTEAFNGDISGWNVSSVTDMSEMFNYAEAFNGDISGWDVSSVRTMANMFYDDDDDDDASFPQNLGEWYIVLDDTTISDATETLAIRAKNEYLDGQTPTYGLGQGGDSGLFVVSGRTLGLNSTVDYSGKSAYSVNITSTGAFGTGNHRMVDITVDEMRDSAGDFVTTWRTSAANQDLTIPVHTGSTYNYTVIWDDGSNSTHTGAAVHTYADAGDHKVRIYGTFPGIHLDGNSDASKLVSIDQWGSNPWTTMDGAFADATNMVYNATDIPDLSRVTNMYSMFYNARAFNGNISGWNVSGVTNMNAMFDSASAFNGNISGWDVSGVTDMGYMFDSASAFNGTISGWNVSKVIDMNNMFADADSFNGNISGWDVSGVTDMDSMFTGSNFNQPLNDWNVSSVADMSLMFSDADSFNGDISNWNVSSVTDMRHMFRNADSFNGTISGWNVSGVTDMRHMFRNADSFNGNISGWDVSKVTNMINMFTDTVAFNGDISGWDVLKVTNMNFMFANATAFNGNISGWNVSKVIDMESMFANATAFNGDITKWDTSSVLNMDDMFSNAASFDQPLGVWKVSSVTTMSRMFSGANAFDQNLGAWYIMLNSTAIDRTNIPGMIGQISPQNKALDNQRPVYDTVPNIDSARFVIDSNLLKMTSITPAKATYIVNITATGPNVFENGNNWRAFEVTVNGDVVLPAPTLSTTATSPTNAASVTVTVNFGEAINATAFDLSDDVAVTGGTASSLSSQSGNQIFTFTITPDADGEVTASIPADRVTDLSGNNNTASNSLSVTFDRVAFSPALSTSAASPTNAASVTVTVDFGEPINPATFTLDDISVTGGDASVLAQEGATTQKYTFTVTPSSDGQLTVTIPADRVTDPADNANTVSNALSITFDSAAPGPTLSTDAASPTNAASATVTVDFGEPINPATFTLDDISVTGGDASVLAQEGATTQKYTFTVTPSSDGQLTVTIPADRVTDPADNANTVSNALSITFDSAAPGPTLSTDATSPTNAASATVTVDFGEPINPATFTLDDISVTGGDASVLAQEGATTQKYTFTVTPSSDGQLTVTIPADRVTDPADNANTVSNALSITFDSAAPDPTLSTDTTSPTNAASATVTVDFGEPINPATFTLDDISVTGGTASNLAHSSANQIFIFTITPDADGEVTASILADRVTDPADNANTVSNALSITFDSAAPGPTLSTDADSPTNAASVTVTVDFGKPIDPTTFTLGDISATGGTASNLAHSSANQIFTFTITPDADGEVTASIPADRVTDPADNANTASNVLSVTFDRTAPGPTLSTDATSPTNAASVTVTVDFGKPIDPTTFTLGDISATGGTASNLAHSSANQNFTFTITPDADGEVTASIPADRVMDLSDNNNTVSNALSITFDSAAPGPTLSTDTTSPTNSASATITVDFGEPIDATTFTLDDISVTGGDASGLAQEGSTTQKYTFTITPDADGEVTASIPADRVMDLSGNNNTASDALSITFDRAAFSPALSTDADSPTNAASVTVTVDFGKPIDPTTFTLGDISATGGTASNLAHSSANQNFTFTITPDADGEVTASIPADRVTDPADNANTASNVLPITFDRTAPGPTLSTDTTSPTNSASATITVDFGEPIDATTFTLDDISVTGGDASGLAQEGSTTQKYTFAITPDADGEVIASIPADRVADIVGNANTASNILSVVFDRTSPGTTDPTLGSRPNVQCLGYVPYPNNSPVVDVGEDITIAEGETGTLRATVTDMDGDDVETFWVHWKPGTAIITIADPESLVTEFTAPYVDGDTDAYVILHACDGIHTGVGNDVVRITVTDIPEPPEPATPPQLPPPVQEPPVYNEEPSVDAGADFTINEGATGQLSGTATDPDNDQLTMEWYQTPTWPLLTLTDASDPRTTIVAPQVDGDTTITLILSVSDGDYIVPDQVRITIIDTG